METSPKLSLDGSLQIYIYIYIYTFYGGGGGGGRQNYGTLLVGSPK